MLRIDTRYHGFDQPGSATKIGGIALPNFNSFYFNTKTAPAMSDENYKNTIVEQAKKDAASGKFQTESKDYTALMKSYVSVASPDRKAIITSGLNRLFNKGGLSAKKEIEYPTSFFDAMVPVRVHAAAGFFRFFTPLPFSPPNLQVYSGSFRSYNKDVFRYEPVEVRFLNPAGKPRRDPTTA